MVQGSSPPEDKDVMLLAKAYRRAIKFSEDPNTQNSAFLYTKNSVELWDVNRLPHNIANVEMRWEPTYADWYVTHAESNVIHTASRAGYCTEGSTIYCPMPTCLHCAKSIINAGVKELVWHNSREYKYLPNRHLIDLAAALMEEAGVKVRGIEHFFDIEILVNQKKVRI